jgi:hypothetical protein
MIAFIAAPEDRAAFDAALEHLHSDHAMLRHMALSTRKQPSIRTDDILSLADAMDAHEKNEARLFSRPFLSSPPDAVTVSAARAHLLSYAFVAGGLDTVTANEVAARFVDALLAHLTAEDDWLTQEMAQHREPLNPGQIMPAIGSCLP